MPSFDTLRHDLRECFRKLDANASYACALRLPLFPHPGLAVNAVGPIGLPLTDATKLKAVCHPAAFGKREFTVVDDSVRKTLEINADQVSFANPAWQSWINSTILPSVLTQLGVSELQSQVTRAELYKLLLYDEGAMFKRHQDSEKTTGMFGTLAICLPTAHEGGELLLYHGSDTKRWTSSHDSLYTLSYGAWYSDVFHEILPVKSGHRLVLVYNLIHTLGPIEYLQAATCGLYDLRLERALESWNDMRTVDTESEVDYLCWALEHQYTEQNLSLSSLKGHDRSVVEMTARTAPRAGYAVYLATVERRVHGACEEYYDDGGRWGSKGDQDIVTIYDDTWLLREVVDLNGLTVTSKVDISEEEMIQQDLFDEDVEPCKEDFSGFTGNEGVTNTLWYRVSVMVIIPNDGESSFCLGPVRDGKVRLEPTVRALMARCQNSPSDSRLKNTLTLALTTLIDPLRHCSESCYNYDSESDFDGKIPPRRSHSSWSRAALKSPSESLVTMSRGAVLLDRPDIFSSIISGVQDCPREKSISKLGRELAARGLSRYTESLTVLFKTYKSPGSLIMALNAFTCGLEAVSDTYDANIGTYLTWSRPILQRMFRASPCSNKQDVCLVASTVKYRDAAYFNEDIIPWAKRQSNPQTQLTFLNACLDNWSDIEDIGVSPTWYIEGMKAYLPHFQLASPTDEPTRRAMERLRLGQSLDPRVYNSSNLRMPDTLDASAIARTIIKLWDLGALQLAESFLAAIMQQAVTWGQIHAATYNAVTLHILEHLAAGLRDPSRHAQRTPTLRRQFNWILTAFVAYHVGPPPNDSSSWSKVESKCGCEDCAKVNEFMRHPSQVKLRFKAAEVRRSHIQNELGMMDCHYEVERNGIPYTLIITKHHGGCSRWLAMWREKISKARNQIDYIARRHEDVFADMTGHDWEWLSDTGKMEAHITAEWVAVVKLACMRPDRGFTESAGQAQRSLEAVIENTLKRKAEMIEECDLTED